MSRYRRRPDLALASSTGSNRSARQRLLSSASTLAFMTLAVVGLVNGIGVGAAHALTYCSYTTSGSTATFNLNGTTCTVPIIPGYTANITNNPATAGAAGTLYQDASVFTYVGGTSASTPTGTITDGTAQTGVTINFPGYTLTNNLTGTYTGPTNILGGTLIEGAANLAAPNSVTTISGGVLDFGGYAQTINNVQLAGGTLQNGSLTGSITSSGGTINNIGGSTGLTTTAGVTTLGGANGYTGATTVNGGTLSVGSGASITSSSSLTVNGGTFNNAGTSTFSGAMTVGTAGTIANSGTINMGTLTNSGVLNNAGNLYINSGLTNNGTFTQTSTGFYQIEAASAVVNNGTFNSAIGSNALTITNNGTWNGAASMSGGSAINTSGATWTGDVTNPGGTVTNNGTWITTSAGVANGATFTNTGTLNVTNGGLSNTGTFNASGTIIGAVTNSAAFSLTGNLSGVSAFSQTAGTLDLASYTLTTTNPLALSGGTIQNGTIAGPGNAINAIVSTGGAISNVTNTALVAMSGTTTVTGGSFPALYTSAGATVTAAGGLSFSGTAGVGGVGTINGNIVVGNGMTVANDAVIAPGTFSATGTSSGYTVAQTGPGTLTVNGNVTLNTGGTLQVAATPTAASLLAVNGATTISGAAVAVNAQNATYAPSTQYKILSATGGVSGSFSGVSANFAYLTPSLSYDANDAYLTLASNGQSIQSVLTTPNTVSVGAAINSAPNSALYKAFQTLTPAQAQAAANSISGEGNTSTQTAGTAATRTFTNFIGDRATPGGSSGGAEVSTSAGAPAGVRSYAALADYEANTSPIVVDRPKPPQGLRIFGTAFGGASNLDGSASGIAGQSASYYGGLIGVDYKIPNTNLLVGAAIGGSDTDFTVGARSTTGSVTGVNANVFGIATFGTFYGQSLTTLSGFSNSTTRNIAGFGGLSSAVEKASYGSFEWRQRLEVGRVYDLSDKTKITGFKVTPFAAMEIAQLSSDGYSEYNPGDGSNVFGLSSNGHTFDDARTFLGARMEMSYALTNGMTLRPIVRLAWVHAFTSSPTSTNTFQSIPGATFVVAGATVAHNAAETKIGAELDIRKNTVVFANFDGEFGNVEQIYGGRAGVRYSF